MIPLFGIGLQGKSPTVTAQYRLNLYFEYQQSEDRTQVAAFGTPGLELFFDLGETAIRGIHEKGDFLYVVHRGIFWEVTNAAVKTNRGSLNTTSGRVDISDNGAQIMITDGTDGYIYDIARTAFFAIEQISTGTTDGTTASKLVDSGAAFDTDGTVIGMTAYNTTDTTDAIITAIDSASTLSIDSDIFVSGETYEIGPDGFPTTPSSNAYLDTYFIAGLDSSSKFQISDNSNGGAWNALDFANAESDPDNTVKVFANNSELILFGGVSTEFWSNTGGTDFPFSRVAIAEWGLAAKWSIERFDNTLIYLAKNRMGGTVLVKLNGYIPQQVSTPEWEYIISTYADVSTATGFSYMLGGHPMYQINFAEASWLYDGTTGLMSEVRSAGKVRHRADTYAYYLGQTVVGDYSTGKVYKLKKDTYTDNGEMITRQLRGRHIFDDNWHRVTVDQVQLFMQTGVGLTSGQGSDPQAMLRISKDGGQTFGNQMWQSFGKIGEYLTRIIWRRLGTARDWIFELTITDPVKVVIVDTNIKFRKASS